MNSAQKSEIRNISVCSRDKDSFGMRFDTDPSRRPRHHRRSMNEVKIPDLNFEISRSREEESIAFNPQLYDLAPRESLATDIH
jgi:hypothetical protein